MRRNASRLRCILRRHRSRSHAPRGSVAGTLRVPATQSTRPDSHASCAGTGRETSGRHAYANIGNENAVILAGRRINDRTGAHVAETMVKLMLQSGIGVCNSRILVLGVAFKENCPDLRNTRVIDIIQPVGCGDAGTAPGLTRTVDHGAVRPSPHPTRYANEGNPREPAHVHVRSAGREAKFWLTPNVQLARNDGFDASSLRRIERQVRLHRETFLRAWNEYFA